MMKRNKEKISKPVETIDTLIGAGSILQGDLEFTGGLQSSRNGIGCGSKW